MFDITKTKELADALFVWYSMNLIEPTKRQIETLSAKLCSIALICEDVPDIAHDVTMLSCDAHSWAEITVRLGDPSLSVALRKELIHLQAQMDKNVNDRIHELEMKGIPSPRSLGLV